MILIGYLEVLCVCEGVAKSPDVRVISAIVPPPPGCVVRPIGSKQGLAQRILGGKDIRTADTKTLTNANISLTSFCHQRAKYQS